MTPGDSSAEPDRLTFDLEANREPLPATEEVLSGFCHDLNGQLASALGFVYLIGPPAGVNGPLEHLRSSLEEIEVLVRQLRGIVRDGDRSADPTSLAELLRALEKLIRQHPRFPGATIVVDGPDDLPAVRVDFASGLRVLLLAVDAVVGGAPVSTVEIGVEERTDRVRISLGPRGTGARGPADPLVREAREAQVAVGRDPEGRVLWLEIRKLG